MNGPIIRDRRIALWGGLALFVVGGIMLRDAYEGRGRNTPLIMRPFTWW
jgi:hypothetical protein